MFFFFDKSALPQLNKRFKIGFNLSYESFPVQKTVSELFKTWYFSYSAFGWQASGGGGTAFPPGYATAAICGNYSTPKNNEALVPKAY